MLSNILKVPKLNCVEIVLKHTQSDPLFTICTNSNVARTTSGPLTTGSIRPSTNGNSLLSSNCLAYISESVSQVVFIKMLALFSV